MVKLVGVIRKPSEVGEWPFWMDYMNHLDGKRVDVPIGKTYTYPKENTGLDKPQNVMFIDDKTAINIMWIHEMEFVYD